MNLTSAAGFRATVRLYRLLVISSFLLQACVAPISQTNPSPRPRPSSGAVFALLADQTLAFVSHLSSTARIEEFGSPPAKPTPGGHYFATSANNGTLFTLLNGSTPERVAIIDVAQRRAAQTFDLDPTIKFRSLAVGQKSGRLFLFGNRSVPFQPGEDVVVQVLDPNDGHLLVSLTIRDGNGRDWFVYEGAVSPDENQLFVSYHGPDTTGIDVFDLKAGHLGCAIAADGNGCISSHGAFTLYADRIFAATGGPEIVETTTAGKIERRFDTGLVNNHLMEFMVDIGAQMLYAVGSCRYVGGLSALSLSSGSARLLVPTGHYSICGERSSLGPGSELVIGTTDALLFVDQSTGHLARTVSVQAEPVDVIYI